MSSDRLPGGYKQTEVGVIPEDWDAVLLDSVARRGSGHTPDKKHPEYWNGSIKWISLKDSDVLDNLYIEDTADKTTPLGIANSSAVVHPEGTVVLSRDAGIGKSAIIKDEMAVSQHFIAWQCSPLLNNHFLYYWLQIRKPEFERIAIGNTIKTIGLPYFKELKIPFPAIEEQQSIAQALSDVDALIAVLDKLIAKKRYLRTATMQQLLTGKKRLPGFGEGKGYKQTEVGVIPEDWDIVPITKVTSEIFLGLTTKVDYVDSGGVPLIRASDIADGRLSFDNARTISVRQHKDLTKYRRAKHGDILVSKSGSLGVCALVDVDTEFSIYESIIVLQANSLLDSKFLLWLVRDEKTQVRMIGEKVGSTVGHLNLEMFRKLVIPLPAKEEQRAIATVLSDMDAEITALEARRAKTQALKQGMMQELLTGRTRLV